MDLADGLLQVEKETRVAVSSQLRTPTLVVSKPFRAPPANHKHRLACSSFYYFLIYPLLTDLMN